MSSYSDITLFLIGGASRSGKSTLCRRLHEVTGYPYFHLDGVFMGVQRGFKELPSNDIKQYTYAIIPGLVVNIIYHGYSYIIEGGWLGASVSAKILRDRRDMDIRVVYLGFPNVSISKKMEEVFHFDTLKKDWLARKPHAMIKKYVEEQIAASARFRDQCQEYGLRFCDTSDDFDSAIDDAVRLLTTANLWPNARRNSA